MGKFHNMMERDLKIKGYSEKTQKTYLNCMRNFVGYHMRPPDELGIDEIRQYQYYLVEERKVSWSSFNQSVCAIRFFYNFTLKRDIEIKHIPYQRKGCVLPEIVSKEEVSAMIKVITNIKHRTLFLSFIQAG